MRKLFGPARRRRRGGGGARWPERSDQDASAEGRRASAQLLCRAADAASGGADLRDRPEAARRDLEPRLRAADRRRRLRGASARAITGRPSTRRSAIASPTSSRSTAPTRSAELYSEYAVTADDGLGFSAENWCVMPKLGNQLYLAIDAGPIHDEAGNLIAVVETLRDMTDQKRAEMALKTLAAKDGLTGLANRRSFDQTLEMRMGARPAHQQAAGAAVRRRRSFQAVQRQCTAIRAATNACARSPTSIGKTSDPADRPRQPAMAARNSPSSCPTPTWRAACAIAERMREAVMELRHRASARPRAGATSRSASASPRYVPGQEVVGARLAARPGRPGALCRQTSRPQPRGLRRHACWPNSRGSARETARVRSWPGPAKSAWPKSAESGCPPLANRLNEPRLHP